MIRSRNVLSPSRELGFKVATRRGFVNSTVNFPAKRVNRIHGISSLARKEEEGIIKITATLFCRESTVRLGFSGRHQIGSNKEKARDRRWRVSLRPRLFHYSIVRSLEKGCMNSVSSFCFPFQGKTYEPPLSPEMRNLNPKTFSSDILPSDSLVNRMGPSD